MEEEEEAEEEQGRNRPPHSAHYLEPGVGAQLWPPGAAGQDGDEDGPGLALPLGGRGVGHKREAVGLGTGNVLPVLDLLALHLQEGGQVKEPRWVLG